MMKAEIIKKYQLVKDSLSLGPRYLEVFEFKNGITDGRVYTLIECAKKFGVSRTRIQQIEARVLYGLENL